MADQVNLEKKERKPFTMKFTMPFHVTKPVLKKGASLDLDYHVFVERMEVDKDTLVVTPVFGRSSWQEEIEAQVDNCGMELMKKQLRQGLIKPSDLYDDGKGGIDTSIIPETVHEARKKADEVNHGLSELAKAIGIDDSQELSADQFVDKLTSAIKAKWNEQQAAKATEGEQK